MQKNGPRTSSNSAKVTKKTTKKMGTPSPPKKRKPDREKNEAETAKTSKKKTPLKKPTVIAKKGNVGRKDLKTTTKKVTPVKAARKTVLKGVKKPPVKRVAKPKMIAVQSKKSIEEDDVSSSKAKKLKKSDEVSNDQIIKTTAKKPNSKQKSSEQAVKSPLPTDLTPKNTPVKTFNPKPRKSLTPKRQPVKPKIIKKPIVKKDCKKPALVPKIELPESEPTTTDPSKLESTKIEYFKFEPSKPESSKSEPSISEPIESGPIRKEPDKLEPSNAELSKLETTKSENTPKVIEVVETETKVTKKCLEVDKKVKKIEEDLESKETIAKLLKEASKTMLKGTNKKRELLDLRRNQKLAAKKSKLTKPKKDQSIVKRELEDAKELVTKKVVKKRLVKIEEKLQPKEVPPKLEVLLKAEPDEKEAKTVDEEKNTNTDDSTTSDELTLNQIRQNSTPVSKSESCSSKCEAKPIKLKKKIKLEQSSDSEKKVKPTKKVTAKSLQHKKKLLLLKKKACKIKDKKRSVSTDTEQRGRKLKLYSWWTGPKRHRVASLNALAKVHCLYENETRGALYDAMKSPVAKESNSDPEHTPSVEPIVEVSSRILRTVPGGRGVGKHWENNETSSSSSCEDNSNDSSVEDTKVTSKLLTPPPSYKQKLQKETAEVKLEVIKDVKEKKKPVRKKRNRTELIMDLKDMVVRKRMASLNASAMLAASYSVEKRHIPSSRSSTSDEEDDSDASVMADDNFKRKCFEEDVKKEEDRKLIEVRASPNKKVAVILNQDTDVTITGVYVNSTTRSTHHEGYCSIAGMQYRISATSHTQTAATAVATETLLHTATDHQGTGEQPLTVPCKSYTPLGALSSMQPPGSGVGGAPPPISPSGRRHGCPSAFTAPPAYGPPPPPPGHHHHPGPPGPPPPPSHHPPPHSGADQQPPPPTYIHGYYQPAGPLITAHHGHSHPPPAPAGKAVPLPTLEASPSPTPPPTTHQPPPSSTGTAESSDNEVIITSASSGTEPAAVQLPPPAQQYRYATQYAPAGAHGPPGYSYSYPPSQYYHSAPSGFAQQHYHHDICYPGSSYPASYLHPKAYATTYRRYLPPTAGPQYYPGQPELYAAPPSNAQNSQVVTASSGGSSGGSGYQPPPSGPPPPTLVESYAPPPPPVPPTIVEPYPPPHYYTSYGTGPAPPACYTHSPPTRNLTYIDAAYQSCPCPMQSCPKNVHTGPLTGDGKRSNGTAIAKESKPLPPVALALPLEPTSVTGPPSPARGSAGMPPPPSPAGATYQPCPTAIPKWDAKQETIETVLECKVMTEKRGKARVGKTMVRNSITSNMNTSGMLLMCHNPPNQQQVTAEVVNNVKREVESPEEIVIPAESQQKHDRIELEKATNQILETEKTEVQMQNDCNKRLAPEINQKMLKNEDCSDSEIKNLEIKEPSPQKVEPLDEAEVKSERITVKRKLSIEDATESPEDYKVEVKKPKTSPKIKPANGSYKDLFKKNNNNNHKSSNVKQKLVEAKVIERKFLLCKTPKIMLGRSKKTKRKQTSTKDEPVSKRAKTSKPLVASNLHNSKQNTTKSKENISKVIADLTANKQPTKKCGGKKVNSKSNNLINNVDRIIESVILNSVVEDVRTSVDSSVLPKRDKLNLDILTDNNNSAVKTNLQTVTRVAPNNIHNNNNNNNKVYKVGSGRAGKRKTKVNSCTPLELPVARIPRKSIHLPRWSNGWSWEGEPFQGKVFLTSDEALVTRMCYPAMRHSEGDIISPRDCVLLKAGPRKIDLPFVAKVAALWEDEEGEMMMSLLWYYRPEHTEQGRKPADQPDEVFASRHKDTNSVACIEDKCYVLTFNEYCRYRKLAKRLEEGMDLSGPVVPLPEGGVYQRQHRQPPLPVVTAPDLVFFCRQVYDFRQKRLARNPS